MTKAGLREGRGLLLEGQAFGFTPSHSLGLHPRVPILARNRE